MESLKDKAAYKIIQKHQISDDLLQFLINKFYVYIPLKCNKYGTYSHDFCFVIYSSLEKAQERIKALTEDRGLTKDRGVSIDIIYMKYSLDPRYPYNRVWVLSSYNRPILVTNDENLYNENKQLITSISNVNNIDDEGVFEIDNDERFYIKMFKPCLGG